MDDGNTNEINQNEPSGESDNENALPLGAAAFVPDLDAGRRDLARERARDGQNNLDPRPPADELILFQSVTSVEIYKGDEIDRLIRELENMTWTDKRVPDTLQRARQGSARTWTPFYLSSSPSNDSVFPWAISDLPLGVRRIYAECQVFTPNLVVVVFTFVLDEKFSKVLDTALRSDVDSQLHQAEKAGKYSISDVYLVKKEKYYSELNQITDACFDWIRSTIPGSLSSNPNATSLPTMALISLTTGIPFETQANYMAIIGLSNDHWAEHFESPDWLYLSHPIQPDHPNRTIAAFSRTSVDEEAWQESAAPERFHETAASAIIVEGIGSVIQDYAPKLREIRDELNILELGENNIDKVFQLRRKLLVISREVTSLAYDVRDAVSDNSPLWSDFIPIEPVNSQPSSTKRITTYETSRDYLIDAIEAIEYEERHLRELVLITTSSVGETAVVNLTKRVGILTIWLIVLTIALVILGVATLLVQVFHAPAISISVAAVANHAELLAPRAFP